MISNKINRNVLFIYRLDRGIYKRGDVSGNLEKNKIIREGDSNLYCL